MWKYNMKYADHILKHSVHLVSQFALNSLNNLLTFPEQICLVWVQYSGNEQGRTKCCPLINCRLLVIDKCGQMAKLLQCYFFLLKANKRAINMRVWNLSVYSRIYSLQTYSIWWCFIVYLNVSSYCLVFPQILTTLVACYWTHQGG